MKNDTARTVLYWIMLLSSVWESIITVTLFFWPEFESQQYHSQLNADTIFFDNILGGFMLLFSGLCWLCTWQVRRRDPHGTLLAAIIGFFWVYMGIGLYLHPGSPGYVLWDTARGAVILLLAFLIRRDAPARA